MTNAFADGVPPGNSIPDEKPNDIWATPAQARQVLHVCDSTLQTWRKLYRTTGEGLPFWQRGRVIRYRWRDLYAMAVAHTVG